MTTSASPDRGPLHRHRDAGRGLVVCPRDDVDGRDPTAASGALPAIGLDDDRVADERVLGDADANFALNSP